MGTLEKLIAQLCPDGVEYKPLGELGEFYSGLSGKSKDDFVDGNARFISYMNVFSNLSTRTDIQDRVMVSDSEKQNVVEYGDALFTGSSETKEECGMASVMTHHPCEKIYLNSFCFGFRLKDKQVFEPDFMKHLLRSFNIRKQISNTASGVTRFNVSKVRMAKVCLPLPPLPVQKEIVRMLDDMAGLIDALEEELAARKKQYEWCRERLLHEVRTNKHEYKTVGEVFETITDYTAAGSFAMVAQNVVYKRIPDYAQLIRTTDIKSNFQKEDAVYIDRHAFEFLWRVHLDKESIILPNVGNCGEVYFLNLAMLPYAHCALAPNALLLRSTLMNNKFLSYWFRGQDFQTQLKKIIAPNGQSKFNKTDLRKLKIPLVPFDAQQEIVRKLDDMTELIAALEEELAARKQQYEYYRDKLLAFKRKPEVA